MKKNYQNAAQAVNESPVIFNQNIPHDEFTQKAYFFFGEHFQDDEPAPTKDELIESIIGQTELFIDDVRNDLAYERDAESTVETLLYQREAIEALFPDEDDFDGIFEDIDVVLEEAHEAQPELEDMDFCFKATLRYNEACRLGRELAHEELSNVLRS